MVISLISASEWTNYENLMRQAAETFAKKAIVWKKSKSGLDRWKEDNATQTFDLLDLNVLIEYNVRRTWPVDDERDMGSEDKESILIIINKMYLDELGYLDANKNFNYQPKEDRFIIDGITWRDSGHTDTSQSSDKALWTMLILTKESQAT